jgi:hypothetical protein
MRRSSVLSLPPQLVFLAITNLTSSLSVGISKKVKVSGHGPTTFTITTLSIMTFSITLFSITLSA